MPKKSKSKKNKYGAIAALLILCGVCMYATSSGGLSFFGGGFPELGSGYPPASE